MNLTVALFLSEIKRSSCCLGVLDTPQFVSGVLLHTRLSSVLPRAFIFWYVHMPHNITKATLFQKCQCRKVQMKFNTVKS